MYSAKALREIINNIGIEKIRPVAKTIVETIFKALNDYNVDRRGDIGSWVREESMHCCKDILILDNKEKTKLVNKEIIVGIIQLMLKQLAEKIDKIRQVAGTKLQDILYNCKSYEIPEKELLDRIFTIPGQDQAKADFVISKEKLEYSYLPWRSAEFTYKQLTPLIDSEIYREALLEGWVISAGGITESTLRASSNSLLQYLAQADIKKKVKLIETLINIMKRNKKTDRVLVPLITTIDLIYQGNYMNQPELAKIGLELFKELQSETKSKNIIKVFFLIL